jgi:hypothetical protein
VDFNKNKYDGGSYTIIREGSRNLAVWKLTDLLEMGYHGDLTEYNMLSKGIRERSHHGLFRNS